MELAGSDVRDRNSEESEYDVAVHEALERLSKLHPQRAMVVRLKQFGDLSIGQIAETLQLTEGKVRVTHKDALQWLSQELRREFS